jgi:hypothetical protein
MSQAAGGNGGIRTWTISGAATVGSSTDHERPPSRSPAPSAVRRSLCACRGSAASSGPNSGSARRGVSGSGAERSSDGCDHVNDSPPERKGSDQRERPLTDAALRCCPSFPQSSQSHNTLPGLPRKQVYFVTRLQ